MLNLALELIIKVVECIVKASTDQCPQCVSKKTLVAIMTVILGYVPLSQKTTPNYSAMRSDHQLMLCFAMIIKTRKKLQIGGVQPTVVTCMVVLARMGKFMFWIVATPAALIVLEGIKLVQSAQQPSVHRPFPLLELNCTLNKHGS